MSLYAVIKGNVVDCIAIADAPLDTDGVWVCVDGMKPQPGPCWTYENGEFIPPPAPSVIDTPPPPKTEEEKLAEATAAAIAKLIADGVLKQV